MLTEINIENATRKMSVVVKCGDGRVGFSFSGMVREVIKSSRLFA